MISFHVAHAAWAKGRPEHLDKMLSSLPFRINVVKSIVKEHASVWARKLWEAVAYDDQEWSVCLNDDVDVCPSKPVWEAALSQSKGDIVSLHTSCTESTDHPWVRCYWMTGPGYALRRGVAQKLLDFYDSLPAIWQTANGNNEDLVGILYAWSKQEPIWSTVPALVQHRTEIESTLGYDHHRLRQSPVPWTDASVAALGDPGLWRPTSQPPFIENPWMPSATLDVMWRAIKIGHLCSFCCRNVACVASQTSEGRMCWDCLRGCMTNMLPRVTP
jgi:hypothetical protein